MHSLSYRFSGKKPYCILLIHGGPGAWGEMAPLADFLKETYGVIEHFQVQASLEGQLIEIQDIILNEMQIPVILIGFSWGAWLAYICAAKFPNLVNHIILIGSGPYEQRYFLELQQTRKERMTKKQLEIYHSLLNSLQNSIQLSNKEINNIISEFGLLCKKIDHYNVISEPEVTQQPNIINELPNLDINKATFFQEALNTVQEMRKSGNLLRFAHSIICPITIIHGDYDPHPAEGVIKPLSHIIPSLESYILKQCGHKPWIEKHAKNKFFTILRKIISSSESKSKEI